MTRRLSRLDRMSRQLDFMMLLAKRGSGGGGPGGGDVITAPVLSLAVGPTTYPPEFDALLDETVVVGDTIVLKQYSDARVTTIVNTFSHVITAGEAIAGTLNIGATGVVAGTYYYDAHIERGASLSPSSNSLIHGAAADVTPSAFTFTDQTNVALSTLITSAPVQLVGFNQGVVISGGPYAISADGVTYSSFTSSPGTAYPNDWIKAQVTSSASNSTAVDATVTVGGVSDTFRATTLAATYTPTATNMLARFDADDLSTLFQLITAATPVTVDGDVVGTWQDKSGNGFHLTAVANNSTRPVWRDGGGLPYVEGDGSDDLLRRVVSGALGLYNGGSGCTIMIAMRTTASTAANNNLSPFGESNSTLGPPRYAPLATVSATNDVNYWIRNDANSQLLSQVDDNAFDGNDTVIIITDDGAGNMKYYEDSASVAVSKTYARSTITLDQFVLFASRVGTSQACRIYSFIAWSGVQDEATRQNNLSYGGAKQGRPL